jgi:hypothetical protein
VDLHEYLDRVQDRASFLDFVRALIDDREEEVAQEREKPSNLSGSWENGTIEDFLFAALRWADDSEGQEEGLRVATDVGRYEKRPVAKHPVGISGSRGWSCWAMGEGNSKGHAGSQSSPHD